MLTASEKVKSLLSSISSDNSVKNTGLFTSPTTQSLLEPQSYDVSDTIIALTYNPDKIWHFLCTLHSPAELKTVADFWKLPKELDKLFTNELKMDLNSVCAYILIAKAKELILTKEYSQAVILLEAAEKTVRNAVKIQKIIRWELLYCNLLSSKSGDGKSTSADTTQKVKSCLYSLKVDSELYPHDNLVIECVSYLLLSKDWEYLSSLHDTRVAYTEYARQMINVCKELPAVQYAKAPGKVLWESSIVIFSLQNVGKRVRLGNQAMLPKDAYKKFILTINEPLVLSVLISLLTKIYSLKTTDTDIDKTNQFSSVWPESMSMPLLNSIDKDYICELMIQLVQHALSINSMQSSWLKTYAEIQFAVGNLRDAMKYYLQSANVASNNFMQPVPSYVFDKEVYTRMVKCCVQLKQYTQAAVLSQLFEEPDYMATFKYLQEKECHDGMDIYYDYLWDINIMEYLIHLHDKRGELDKKQQLITIISNPEINTNNPEPILQTCRSQKTAKFFRLLCKQYGYEAKSFSFSI
ncbi:INTS8 [Bugula neritina]|uniref:INTS8 n=1 Tax=Bugula neritina TaxID=10212 RepID=A0A7J7JN92_BUGNE|nr:INTS8 [Bugula neritina]